MPLRETRRFKTKGFVISFGDLMLPLVGLVAIGLLVVAGKMFFFSGFQADNQPIPISAAPPDTPKPASRPDTTRAEASEGAKPSSPPQPQATVRPQAAAPTPPRTAPAAVSRDTTAVSRPAAEVVVVAIPSSQPAQPAPAPRTPPRPTAPAPARQQPRQSAPRPAVRPAQPTQPGQTQQNWRVQVGAYSTKASADSVARTLSQAGHTAAVVSGRLHKVLIQAGGTRQEALNLAVSLQGRYPGAFVVPPGA